MQCCSTPKWGLVHLLPSRNPCFLYKIKTKNVNEELRAAIITDPKCRFKLDIPVETNETPSGQSTIECFPHQRGRADYAAVRKKEKQRESLFKAQGSRTPTPPHWRTKPSPTQAPGRVFFKHHPCSNSPQTNPR